MLDVKASIPLRTVLHKSSGVRIEEFNDGGRWRVRLTFTKPGKGKRIAFAPHEIKMQNRAMSWQIFQLVLQLLSLHGE